MTTTEPRRPRVRLSFRLVAIAAFVVLLPIALHALWDYVEARRLSKTVEAIRQRGEPVHFGRIGEGSPTTPEQTRASRYYGAAALLTADASGGPRFIKAGELIDAMSREPGPIPASDPRIVELQSLSDSYAPALELMDRAAALDANGLDYSSEPRYGFIERKLSNVNALRVARLALTGDGDGAAKALMSTLRVRRVVNDRFGLNFPVTTANTLRTLLTAAPPSEPSLRALQQAYQERDDEDRVTRNLLTGRGVMIQAVWPGAEGELTTLPRVRDTRPRAYPLGLMDFTLRPWATRRFTRMLSVYAEAIEASKQPWPAKLDAAKALEARYPIVRPPFGTRSVLGLPPGSFEHGPVADFVRITRQEASMLSQHRICMTVLAVERFRRARHDLPASLDALVPEFLTAVPKDPQTGGPLRYTRSVGEYKVYSDGANRRDDNGDLGPPHSDLSAAGRQSPNDIGLAIRLTSQR